MKKFLTALFSAILVALFAVGIAACGGDTNSGNLNPDQGNTSGDPIPVSASVYMPDGAPALAAAQLMTGEITLPNASVEYHVVDSTVIQTYVTGENPQADLCILPVNAASKLLGTGSVYQLLGTVTHGNLFLLKKADGEDITADHLDRLKGKTVGVIQLAQVPGLTLKVILGDHGIEYNVLDNSNDVAEDKVNLLAIDATEATPANNSCDYFVVPEPAATPKVGATTLEFAGDLQELYGGSDGYPQAVLVAKKSLIESSPAFVEAFMQAMTDNANGIVAKLTEEGGAAAVVDAINSCYTKGGESTLNANNLNAAVATNCAIRFVSASDSRDEIDAFLAKLIAVDPTVASAVSEDFYYIR